MKFVNGIAMLGLVAVVAAPMRAQTAVHPNFTGSWAIDPTKTVSEGPMAVPTAAIYTIVQTSDSVVVDGVVTVPDVGEVKRHDIVGFDGRAWKNVSPQPSGDIETMTTMNWDKDVLAMHLTASVQGYDVTVEQTWTMAPDGKSFANHQVTMVGGQEYQNLTLVFVKKS